MRVYAPSELAKVDWHQRPDGLADIRLRRDIKKVTTEPIDPEGEAQVQWSAEEQYLCAQLSEAEAAERFDELWSEAERASMSEEERISATEEASDESQDAIADLSETVSDSAQDLSDMADALAELSQVVGEIKGE